MDKNNKNEELKTAKELADFIQGMQLPLWSKKELKQAGWDDNSLKEVKKKNMKMRLETLKEKFRSAGADEDKIEEILSQFDDETLDLFASKIFYDETPTQLEKTGGFKMPVNLFERIREQFPLSLDGFELEKEEGSIRIWTRKYMGSTKKIILEGAPANSRPSEGDLPKRITDGIYYLFQKNLNLSVGPIRFRNLLNIIGMPRASQYQRQKINDHLDNLKHSSLEIIQINEKGQEEYKSWAPLFKFFKLEGGLRDNAELYYVFNEYFAEQLNDLDVFTWVPKKRLKANKELTDRGRTLQDYLRQFRFYHTIKKNMKEFLINICQMRQLEKKWPLEKIKKFLRKNLEYAKNKEGTIKGYKIKDYRKKSDYLKQTITIFPKKAKRETGRSLNYDLNNPEIQEWLDNYFNWAYSPQSKQYIKNPEEEERQQFENVIGAHGFLLVKDCVERVFENCENWYPDYEYDGISQSLHTKIWECIKSKIEQKKRLS